MSYVLYEVCRHACVQCVGRMRGVWMIHLLVVDDDESLRQLLAYRLSHELNDQVRIRVSEAKSGNEAIELLKAGRKFCLIISDYEMPDGDGCELQDYLIKSKSDSFLMFYSSEANIEFNLAHQNCLGVVRKPDFSQLKDQVKLAFTLIPRQYLRKLALPKTRSRKV